MAVISCITLENRPNIMVEFLVSKTKSELRRAKKRVKQSLQEAEMEQLMLGVLTDDFPISCLRGISSVFNLVLMPIIHEMLKTPEQFCA